jgi:hypothetical protein
VVPTAEERVGGPIFRGTIYNLKVPNGSNFPGKSEICKFPGKSEVELPAAEGRVRGGCEDADCCRGSGVGFEVSG